MRVQHHLQAGQERDCDILCQFLLVQANCLSLQENKSLQI